MAAAAQRVIPQLDLGALLEGAIGKAVLAQINAAAKDVAGGVVEDMLTPEVLAGMRETAIAAAQDALEPTAAQDSSQDGQQEEEKKPEPRYKTVEEFVEKYLVHMYRREVSAQGSERSMRWCPSWWAHGEVYARMEALHAAFEKLRLGADVEQGQWWLVYLDQMMDRILDPEGPLKYCSVRKGHSAELVPLPTHPAPERRDDGTYADTHAHTTGVTAASGLYIPPAAPARRVVAQRFP
jgi:hypothetical protein